MAKLSLLQKFADLSFLKSLQKWETALTLFNAAIYLITVVPLMEKFAETLALSLSQPISLLISGIILCAGYGALYTIAEIFQDFLYRRIGINLEWLLKTFLYKVFGVDLESLVQKEYPKNHNIVFVPKVEDYLYKNDDPRVQKEYDLHEQAINYIFSIKHHTAATLIILLSQKLLTGLIYQYLV